ncbi:MAG: PEGA domain-containing protein, partial [Myxococcota bacterium]
APVENEDERPDEVPADDKPGEAAVSADTGAMLLTANVRGEVYVDGRHHGRLPARIKRLPPGEHRVRVVASALEGGNRTRELSVPVTAGQVTERRVVFNKGRLNLRVAPWANVKINGRNYGPTPLAPVSLLEGKHDVVLENAELKARKQLSVTIQAGQETELKVRMTE